MSPPLSHSSSRLLCMAGGRSQRAGSQHWAMIPWLSLSSVQAVLVTAPKIRTSTNSTATGGTAPCQAAGGTLGAQNRCSSCWGSPGRAQAVTGNHKQALGRKSIALCEIQHPCLPQHHLRPLQLLTCAQHRLQKHLEQCACSDKHSDPNQLQSSPPPQLPASSPSPLLRVC